MKIEYKEDETLSEYGDLVILDNGKTYLCIQGFEYTYEYLDTTNCKSSYHSSSPHTVGSYFAGYTVVKIIKKNRVSLVVD